MDSTSERPAIWQWLTLSALLVGTLAFGVARAPASWHRPGPTALWFAALGGLIIGGVAVVHRVKRQAVLLPVTFSLIACAIGGLTAERYRQYVASLEKLYLGPENAANPAVMPTDTTDLAELAQRGRMMEHLMSEMHAERRRLFEARRPFPVFLAFRLEPLGINVPPWPGAFFAGEILLGAMLGTLIAWGIVRQPQENLGERGA